MRKLTNVEAITRLQEKFPHLDCSSVVYTSAHSPVTLVCKKHNHIFSVPYAYAAGSRSKYGCVHCQNDSCRLTQDEMLRRFKEKHGEKYSYSKAVYKNNLQKVEIICPKHGIFMQAPAMHWRGHGCMKCAVEYGRHGVGRYNEKTLKNSRETGVLYVLKINEDTISYKIGITKVSGKKRIKDISYTNKAEVVYESKKILLKDAYKIEQEILKLYKRYKYKNRNISGWTEIISELPDIDLIKKKINKLNYATI